MDNKTIENIIKFMERVDLKGSEVPAYFECMKYLSNKITPEDILNKQ